MSDFIPILRQVDVLAVPLGILAGLMLLVILGELALLLSVLLSGGRPPMSAGRGRGLPATTGRQSKSHSSFGRREHVGSVHENR
jgi:hypothetical protein